VGILFTGPFLEGSIKVRVKLLAPNQEDKIGNGNEQQTKFIPGDQIENNKNRKKQKKKF